MTVWIEDELIHSEGVIDSGVDSMTEDGENEQYHQWINLNLNQ